MTPSTDTRVSAILQLAERCEKATGPDRELDGIIDRLLHDRPNDGDYHAGENCIWRVDDDSGLCVRGDGFARGSFCAASYTASLDAAMQLVPRGWIARIVRGFDDDDEYWSTVTLVDSFSVMRGQEPEDERSVLSRGSGEPPRFICAAALRARAAS